MSAHVHEPAQLTRNQSLVLHTLEQADGPMSAYTILDTLRDDGFRAPLQVYRALEKLIETGMVHRLESLNAFVACRHPGCDGHKTIAFMICEACGKVSELDDRSLERALAKLTADRDFELKKTMIELRGLCQPCKAA